MTNDELQIKSEEREQSENAVEVKSYEFGVKAVKFVRALRHESREYEIASQFLRSATSIGANVSEAQYAQSKRDFASKMAIARKEANEARYWLKLMAGAGIISGEAASPFIGDASELVRILTSIIKTTIENL